MRGEAAFDEFVVARGPALMRTAFLLTGSAAAAEDLLQTVLFHTARRWDRIHESPEAYVRRALYNQNISLWRRRRVREVALGQHDRPVTDGDADLRIAVRAALAQLTVRQRTVLVLRYFEDLTEVQTSDALGISLGTVKSTTRDAFRRLRAIAPELAELTEAGGWHGN